MNILKHPQTLDFESADLSHVRQKWKEEINLYLVKLFLYIIGSKGHEIYETMKFETPDKDRTIEELLKSFSEYCDPRRNKRVERHKFFLQEIRKQVKVLINILEN